MYLFYSTLNDKRIKKILTTKPWEKGFSLVELVVVIAVLAILAAVAIPAFQGVQVRAKVSAVKNGMVNGVKECVVSDGLGLGDGFDRAQAFKGDYSGFTVGKHNNHPKCYRVEATPPAASSYGWFILQYDPTTGVSTKTCDANYDIGCDNGKW